MHVFISWSGAKSQALAAAVREYLPCVIQAATPFFSTEDIDKGARWLGELSAQLSKDSVGIVCVTPDNMNSPWLLFEAGALSKALDAARVCPLLLGLEPSDLKGPLAQFQATRATKEEMLDLLKSINKRSPAPLTDRQLAEIHEALWPRQFEPMLATVEKLPSNAAAPSRTQADMLHEVVDRLRLIERAVVDLREGERAREQPWILSKARGRHNDSRGAYFDLRTTTMETFSLRDKVNQTTSEINAVTEEISQQPVGSAKRSELVTYREKLRERVESQKQALARMEEKSARAARMVRSQKHPE